MKFTSVRPSQSEKKCARFFPSTLLPFFPSDPCSPSWSDRARVPSPFRPVRPCVPARVRWTVRGTVHLSVRSPSDRPFLRSFVRPSIDRSSPYTVNSSQTSLPSSFHLRTSVSWSAQKGSDHLGRYCSFVRRSDTSFASASRTITQSWFRPLTGASGRCAPRKAATTFTYRFAVRPSEVIDC